MVLTSEQEQLYSATFNATKACWVLAGKAANLHKIGSEWIPILETMDSAARLMMQQEGRGEGMEQQQNSEEGEEGMEQRIRHRNWANQQRRIWLNTRSRIFEQINADLMATSVKQFLPTIFERTNGEPVRFVNGQMNQQYADWALGRVAQELKRMHQQLKNFRAKWKKCDAAVREWQHQLDTKIGSFQSSSSMSAFPAPLSPSEVKQLARDAYSFKHGRAEMQQNGQQQRAEATEEEDVWEEYYDEEEEEEYYWMEGGEEEMEMMEEEGGDEYWLEEEEAVQQYHPENIAAQYWQSMLVAQAVEEIEEDVDELEHQFYVSLQHEEEAADEEE